ncbi:iron-sulfur cluster biosynthesis family protein [Cohnella mopanensis]|uniref:iron-sulfur cluster biosynthesis family protein n=1 Tax=Cohnella mopanensis TaxID=2911966 RepID=UPI001EF98312|nr:iron-sulfur cluster biosynthesis family protein [Cohnella mopanensis]
MKIHWSEQAILEVQARFGTDATTWKLVSDSEGCGCSMNGVATFWAVLAPDSDDLHAESNHFNVSYEKRHEVFFDEQMRVTYLPDKRAFQLASDGQIYSNRLKLEDKRTADAAI